MFKNSKELFEIIEKTKIKVNNDRIKKNQTIKDFLKECLIESKNIIKEKELIHK